MGSVSGVVLDADGEPVPDARVYFTSAPGPIQDVAAVTQPDGRFVLTTPLEGSYTLEATVDGIAVARTTVAVAADRVDLELQLS